MKGNLYILHNIFSAQTLVKDENDNLRLLEYSTPILKRFH